MNFLLKWTIFKDRMGEYQFIFIHWLWATSRAFLPIALFHESSWPFLPSLVGTFQNVDFQHQLECQNNSKHISCDNPLHLKGAPLAHFRQTRDWNFDLSHHVGSQLVTSLFMSCTAPKSYCCWIAVNCLPALEVGSPLRVPSLACITLQYCSLALHRGSLHLYLHTSVAAFAYSYKDITQYTDAFQDVCSKRGTRTYIFRCMHQAHVFLHLHLSIGYVSALSLTSQDWLPFNLLHRLDGGKGCTAASPPPIKVWLGFVSKRGMHLTSQFDIT